MGYREVAKALRALCCLGLALAVAGCSQQPLNSPYPAPEAGRSILYSAFTERPKHLDPALSYSSNEIVFTGQIYEPPLQYHFLKRPYTLIPLTAETVPEPSYLDRAGRPLPKDAPVSAIAYSAYEIKIRPGIRYQPHPAFAVDGEGRYRYHALSPSDLESIDSLDDFAEQGTRELLAEDYVYQIKRLAHPRLHSPIFGLMAEYIVGLREYGRTLQSALAAQGAESAGYVDLRRYPLEGAEVVDRYTYRIKVRGKYPQLVYWLAMPFFAPIPAEVDRFYSQPGMADKNLTLDWYPVGTGPYELTVNNPNRQMVLARNPYFHGETYPGEGEPEDQAAGLLADAGKGLPFVDKVVFSLEKEDIPYWNKFLQGYYDASGITSDSFDQAVSFTGRGDVQLTETMEAKGIQLQTAVATSIFYLGFNMLDPVVGGTGEQARRLRQAISIALDYEEYISIFANGRGIPAQGPIPPGIFGEREGVNPYVYELSNGKAKRRSLAEARRLLAEAGYPEGRERRTGEPLIINLDIAASGPEEKARLDWFRKQFAKLNLQLVIRNTDYNRFQDKMRTGNAQLFMWGWNADYPDPENFLFLLYGPNGKVRHGGENAANYASPEFDRLFEQMKNMENGPERQAIIDQMVDVVRRDAPWVWGMHPKLFSLYHAWYQNVKPNLMANNTLKYARIDPVLREERRREWNQPVWWPFAASGAVLTLLLLLGVRTYRQREQRRAR